MIRSERIVLDFGCGIGRLGAALAGEVGFLLGVDISLEMLRIARERAPLSAFARIGGRDLSFLRSASFEVALVVDALPYAVEAGIERALLGEFARVLRTGGDLVILNWSYRGQSDLDVADCQALAPAAGFEVPGLGERPFALWEGTAFRLRKTR